MTSKDPDIEKVNGLPRSLRVEIAQKIEERINNEIGEYDLKKNTEYQEVCKEVGAEYGITMTEAATLFFGWQAFKTTQGK